MDEAHMGKQTGRSLCVGGGWGMDGYEKDQLTKAPI